MSSFQDVHSKSMELTEGFNESISNAVDYDMYLNLVKLDRSSI